MLIKNQKGFGIVEGILIFIALILLVGVGTYVYNANKDDSIINDSASVQKNSSVQNKTTEPNSQKTDVDPTNDWVTYTDSRGRFEFKHPRNWLTSDCEGFTLFLGLDKDSLGLCGSEKFGHMSIGVNGESETLNKTTTEYMPDLIEKSVIVSGVSALKQSGTYNDQMMIGPQEGDKEIRYVFVSNDSSYSIVYSIPKQNPYTDVINDFEMMVEKTFKVK